MLNWEEDVKTDGFTTVPHHHVGGVQRCGDAAEGPFLTQVSPGRPHGGACTWDKSPCCRRQLVSWNVFSCWSEIWQLIVISFCCPVMPLGATKKKKSTPSSTELLFKCLSTRIAALNLFFRLNNLSFFPPSFPSCYAVHLGYRDLKKEKKKGSRCCPPGI